MLLSSNAHTAQHVQDTQYGTCASSQTQSRGLKKGRMKTESAVCDHTDLVYPEAEWCLVRVVSATLYVRLFKNTYTV